MPASGRRLSGNACRRTDASIQTGGGRVSLLALCVVIAVAGSARGSEPEQDAASPLVCGQTIAPGAPVTVAGVTGPTSLRLADGREIRLSGIGVPHRWHRQMDAAPGPDAPDAADPVEDGATGSPDGSDPDLDPAVAAQAALSAWLPGRPVEIAPVSAKPDRYGRIRARVTLAGGEQSVEGRLVDLGLARVEPEADDFGCARALEARENVARTTGLGLWSLPEFAVIAAGDAATRVASVGQYVLVEGIVVSRGISGRRHYLNFGRNFRRDFAVVLVNKNTILPRSKARGGPSRFESEGFDSPAAVGRRVRVRGIMMPGGGGLIWPDAPEEIEWSDRQ